MKETAIATLFGALVLCVFAVGIYAGLSRFENKTSAIRASLDQMAQEAQEAREACNLKGGIYNWNVCLRKDAVLE